MKLKIYKDVSAFNFAETHEFILSSIIEKKRVRRLAFETKKKSMEYIKSSVAEIIMRGDF